VTTFIQLHLLTPYAASNLNRDDVGRPKTLLWGKAERLRISSQSLKRAWRESDVFAAEIGEAKGVRSAAFGATLQGSLEARGLAPEEAEKRVRAVIEHDKLGKLEKTGIATNQLVHLGPDELQVMDALADRLLAKDKIEDKDALVLSERPRAADIALFGRMLADNSYYNIDAAAQVAHAFTTHKATVEDDFYTAVDDLKTANREADRGAGFVGVHEYGAGLFYLYVCLNADQLLDNLSGDGALAQNVVRGLIEAAATVAPRGKQNAYASRSRALYGRVEVGSSQPMSLAAAFLDPIGRQPEEEDVFAASVSKLQSLRASVSKAYGDTLATQEMNARDGGGSLADLTGLAIEAVAQAGKVHG
jgi:CRISPR system Cascade subunit CasC